MKSNSYRDDKYRAIQEELAHLSLLPHVLLSKEQFFALLDSNASNKSFDRRVANELYDKMRKDQTGCFMVDEFVRAYIDCQEILTANLAEAQNSYDEYNKARIDAYQKLEEFRSEEVTNPYGIMEESIMTLQVLELTFVDQIVFKDAFVVIHCGDNYFKTKTSQYAQSVQWNERFNVEITTGKETLHLQVIVLDNGNNQVFLGEAHIPMKSLYDQCFRDELYHLYDQKGRIVDGKLHLKLQWIHSRVTYLETVIKKWEKMMATINKDKQDFEQGLANLNSIFPNLSFEKAAYKPSYY